MLAFCFAHRAFWAFEIAFRAFADILRRFGASKARALSRPLRRMNFTGRSSPSAALRQVWKREREDLQFVEQFTKPDFGSPLGEVENLR